MGTRDVAEGREQPYEEVDLKRAGELLRLAMDRIDDIQGTEIPPPEQGRSRAGILAQLNRELLFLSHLLDSARIAVLDEYYVARGFQEHVEQ